jgi:hypothetical protein
MAFCCLPRINSQKDSIKKNNRSVSLENQPVDKRSSFYCSDHHDTIVQSSKSPNIQKLPKLEAVKSKHLRFSSSSCSFTPVKLVKCKQILLKNNNKEDEFLAHLNISSILVEPEVNESSESLVKEIQKFQNILTSEESSLKQGEKRTIKEFNKYTSLRTKLIPIMKANPCFAKKCNEDEMV